MLIDVCQYIRPNGMKEWHQVEIKDSLKEKYEQLLSVNGFLSAEVLMTGVIMLYLEQRPDGFEVYLRQSQNGPEIITHIEDMFEEFTVEDWNKKVKSFEE